MQTRSCGEMTCWPRLRKATLGCHSASHVSVRCLKMSELERDLEENAGAAREISPDMAFTSFAYPFGEVALVQASDREPFRHHAGHTAGLNGRSVDLAELRAIGLRSETFGAKAVARLARAAVRRRSWLVFLPMILHESVEVGLHPHSISGGPRYRPDRGNRILPLKAALGRMAHRAP